MWRYGLFAMATLLLSSPAFAQTPFAPLPADQTGGKLSGLEIRIVRYDGGTNGAITVDLRNPKKEPIEFTARGLYFVPDADADRAPQRLGAVGPFEVDGDRREKMTIAAGTMVRMKLDVYCIDSHRASPYSATKFHVAKDRVPKQITDDIHRDARKASQSYGGMSAPAAKSAVQSEVWKNRDKKWVPLDGEGKQEAGK
jgi:hypothetical protein